MRRSEISLVSRGTDGSNPALSSEESVANLTFCGCEDEAFVDLALARQFAQTLTVVSLAEGPPTEAQGRLMMSFARALGVDEPAVKVPRVGRAPR